MASVMALSGPVIVTAYEACKALVTLTFDVVQYQECPTRTVGREGTDLVHPRPGVHEPAAGETRDGPAMSVRCEQRNA